MPGLKELLGRLIPLNRRRHKRFPAIDGAFVVLGTRMEDGHKFQIIDVSMGGLAFIYEGSKNDLDEIKTLSIMGGEQLFLDNVFFDPAGTIPMEHAPDINRQGIEFKYLGVLDKAQLKDFIKNNTYKT